MEILREITDFRRRKVNPENKGPFASCKNLFPSFLKEMKKKNKRIKIRENHNLKLMPRSRKCGSIHPLPHTP
jgi:hypothetical protein